MTDAEKQALFDRMAQDLQGVQAVPRNEHFGLKVAVISSPLLERIDETIALFPVLIDPKLLRAREICAEIYPGDPHGIDDGLWDQTSFMRGILMALSE